MSLYTNRDYMEDVRWVANTDLPWEILTNKTILLSGATGLLGSFFVDVLMEKNVQGLNCTIYALGRNREKATERFLKWDMDPRLIFIQQDIGKPIEREDIGTVDFVLHLASNTHPVQYANDPIGTITTNIIGLNNMLDFSVRHQTQRFLFASSNEIYGENRGDTELFDEQYCGYIDTNTLRAGYPESKRCGEALCQAYRSQYGLDVVISRFTRSYGPTMQMNDTKAISQFIKKGVAYEDIVLKSAGMQNYSYTYMADAVYGLLTIMLKGESGEAYNIADEASNITLKELAQIVADLSGKQVVFETPNQTEARGYSKATKALLDGTKLKKMGWAPSYSINEGIARTLRIIRDI